MKIRSWLAATCSKAVATRDSNTTTSFSHHRKPSINGSLDSDTSFQLDSATSSSSISSISLHSDASIQTLPSVPSLQKLTATDEEDSLTDLSVTSTCVYSIKPNHHSKVPITCIAISGSLLYSASNNEINVYDRATCIHLDAFNGKDSSSGSVKSLTECDGKLLTAHQDCKIRVWKLTTAKTETVNKRHRLVTVLPTVNDRLLRMMMPSSYVSVRRHEKKLWIEHADAVTGLAVNDGLIYSVSWDKWLKIWRASDFRCLESIKAHDDAVNAVAVARDGTVYTGSADKRIRVWARRSKEKRHLLVTTLEKHKSAVNALALNADGSVLFSGACDRSILVWEREDSANHMLLTGALRGHGKAILCLVNAAPDMLLSGSADRTVRIWLRAFDGHYFCLAVLDGHSKPVKSLAALLDCESSSSNHFLSVFSGGLDGEIKVWEVSISKNYNSSPQIEFAQ